MKLRIFAFSAAALMMGAALFGVNIDTADANETYTLRFASLAPKGSAWDRAFRAWKNTLDKETGGRIKVKFYLGGAQGDERDYIRKMKAGQLDGAAVTATGLGQIVRPVLVLQVPGVFENYKQIDRVRSALSDEMKAEFNKSGYELMGWGDVGRARLFSKQKILRPSDLKKASPWAWRDDLIFGEFLKVVGANGRKLGVNEVLPALQTGRIDTFPSSALAAVSLQWYSHAKYVTKQTDSVLVGATIVRKDKLDELPPDLRKAVVDSAARAHKLLAKSIRRADDKAYAAMLKRGVQELDLGPYEKEWAAGAAEVRKRLAGRLYPKPLLKRVEQLVAK